MKKLFSLIIVLFLFSCEEQQKTALKINVKNDSEMSREFETVEIDISDLDLNNQSLEVSNSETNETLISQLVDSDADGRMDLLLFQPKINSNSEANFNINFISTKENDSTLIRCYSRFVPERTDDYAWENNRVAFRTFGPVAQQMKEDGVKGGTLTSGIDAWLKRVDYPIINKWYKKHTTETGSYHEDTGEGLDNFHVGVSRGVGGIAIQTDSTFSVSKNFTDWKTITNGPIRTSFILEYADWDANGKTITETKHISLDYGQNLSKFEIDLTGADTISVGLTLHKNDGNVKMNYQQGWMSYWEPFDDSELGQGFVALTEDIAGYNKHFSKEKDKSNLYANVLVKKNKVIYYAGFGWKKSGQFTKETEWHQYLSDFSIRLKNPLEVSVSKQ